MFHGVAEADEGLSKALLHELRRSLGEEEVVGCLNASADSFYSSQGERSVREGLDFAEPRHQYP